MRLTICFLLVCTTVYAATTSKCPENSTIDDILETPAAEGILRYVLEMLLGRFDDLHRKVLELQIEMTEHREEVERNQATNEKTFSDIVWAIHRLQQDVGRNMSVIQDHSLVILDQQKSCANHDRLRERLFDHIPKQNYSSYQTLEHANTPATVTEPPIYASCKDAPENASGMYLIRINNDSDPFKVYCEMEKFGGGWIVMQHRFNGSVDFYRNWADYRDGFGELGSEFWVGLEYIHQLTIARKYELLVELEDFSGNSGYARYSTFQIDSEEEKYRITTLGSFSGTAGDGMQYMKGVKFSTKDQDNEEHLKHYAVDCQGAWWYGYAIYSNLNGRYNNANDMKSNWWRIWKFDYRGMRFSRMMIREM